MEERQPPQISVIDTSSPKQNEQQDVVDLENPPADRQRINNNDVISELENDQYADDDATTYTTYTTYTTIIKRSSYRYRWLTVAIVVITIIIIFLSRGAVVGGGVNAKNQDVENTIDSAVGGGGGGGGGGGSTQVVKVEKSEKSKKSKSGKW